MTKQEFEALVARGPVLLDGAMGSNLLERGMPKGALSELWADRHPETVLELQTAYAAAGSRILYAPTFQAQPEALAQAGWTGDVGALNARLVALTRRAAGADTLVAGDLATMAGCLESWNPENFHRMTDRYRRQIGGASGGRRGPSGGGDPSVPPQEAEAVLLAAELEGGTSLSSIASPCSQTAPFFRPGGGPGAPGAGGGRRCSRGLQLRGGGPRPCRLWCPSSAGMSGVLWCPSPMRATPPSPRRAGWCIPWDRRSLPGSRREACRMGAGLLGGCCGTTPAYLSALRDRLAAEGLLPAHRT